MKATLIALAAASLIAMPAAHAQAESPRPDTSSILVRAEKAQDDATRQLKDDRARRAKARAALTARLQSIYSELEAARRAHDEAGRLRERAETELQRARSGSQKATRAARDLREALRQLAARGGAKELPEELEALTLAVAKGADLDLADLDSATQLSVSTEAIVDRTGRKVEARFVQVGAAARLAAGGAAKDTGLVRKGPGGRWLVDGVSLAPEQARLISRAADGDVTLLPFDLDGALSRRSAAASESRSWLEQGGPFVWPIVFVGLLGLALLIERLMYLTRRRASPVTIGKVAAALATGDVPGARSVVEPPRSDLDRVMIAGLDSLGQAQEHREAKLEAALLAEEPRLERSLTLIGAAAAVAPLLGLLGTVTGMITTFEVITEHGTGNPRLLSGGISVALITTQLGLLVAVPLLLGHAWASRAVERRQSMLEEGRNILLSLEPPKEQP